MTAIRRVLLVTGAYHPQISSSALQCRAIARRLRGRVAFSILTTATIPSLPIFEMIDDVPVHRVLMNAERPGSPLDLVPLLTQYRRASSGADLVHVHGVSRKNGVVSMLAALTGKPVIVTLHTSGQDEPDVIRRRGWLAWKAFRNAARVVSVSARLADLYRAAGLPADRLVQIPNGIDLDRFRPATAADRADLKRTIGVADAPVILFVGFFSRDKRPDFLMDAWLRIAATTPSTLVFVGATTRSYREIDPTIVETLRTRARAAGVSDRVRFVEPTFEIERFYRAADVFVLSSRREAMPVVLLEAMACGVPAVATRLAGVTDTIVTDGVDGLLFDEPDSEGLSRAIASVLGDGALAARLGRAGHETVRERYGLAPVAEAWLRLYEDVAA
jgi:glycosyltransferase involved in cell wall biosynthesis